MRGVPINRAAGDAIQTGAVVPDGDARMVAAALRVDAQLARAVIDRRHGLNGIGQQVDDDLLELDWIAEDDQWLRRKIEREQDVVAADLRRRRGTVSSMMSFRFNASLRGSSLVTKAHSPRMMLLVRMAPLIIASMPARASSRLASQSLSRRRQVSPSATITARG